MRGQLDLMERIEIAQYFKSIMVSKDTQHVSKKPTRIKEGNTNSAISEAVNSELLEPDANKELNNAMMEKLRKAEEEKRTKREEQNRIKTLQKMDEIANTLNVKYTIKLTPGAYRLIQYQYGLVLNEGLDTNTTINSLLRCSLNTNQYNKLLFEISKTRNIKSLGDRLGKAMLNLNICGLAGHYLSYTDAALAGLYMLYVSL